VVLLEDRRGTIEIELVIRTLAPRKLRDPLQVGANHLGFHGLATGALKAAQLALDLDPGLFGEVQLGQLLAQLLDFAGLVVVAELFLDRLHLLAQEHLALPLAQFLLDLRLDLLLRLEHADLPLHVNEHAPQPLLDTQRLEQALFLGHGEFDVAGNEVGKPSRLLDRIEDLVHHLFRQSSLFAEFGRALTSLLVECFERRVRLAYRRHFLGRHNHGAQETVTLGVLKRRRALLSLKQELHSTEAALDLPDAGDNAHRVEDFRRRFVGVVPLGDGENEPIALQRRFNGAQGTRPSRRNRGGEAGENHGPPKREHRKRLSLCHSGQVLRLVSTSCCQCEHTGCLPLTQ
jgi:hypothetical protein